MSDKKRERTRFQFVLPGMTFFSGGKTYVKSEAGNGAYEDGDKDRYENFSEDAVVEVSANDIIRVMEYAPAGYPGLA